jgi:hypothetical protein
MPAWLPNYWAPSAVVAPGGTRAPYVAAADLLLFYDQLPALKNPAVDDGAYTAQIAKASDQFDRDLLVRYDPRPGFVKTRLLAPDPDLGRDVPTAYASAPSPFQLSAYLKAGCVVADTNVREVVARRAIALILDRQEVYDRNTFRQEAQAMRDMADALWKTFDVQIDTDLDGTADMLVGRDVILLPPGTAP